MPQLRLVSDATPSVDTGELRSRLQRPDGSGAGHQSLPAAAPFGKSSFGLTPQELWQHASRLRDEWGWQPWELAERFDWTAA